MSTTKDKINFQNTWSCNKTTGRRSGSGYSCSFLDLQSIRRLLEHDTSGSVCPSCRISFDKGKRRKLIDTCGHERCYSCMFRNDQCPMCMNSSLKDVDCSNTQGYDTGIGGSTSTIVSPLGSPQPQLRSQVQRANELALDRYMQHNRQESISPEYHRYASIGKLPKASSSSLAAANNNKYSQTGNSTALGTTTAPGKAGLKQHTVTADIHNNNGISHGHNNGTSSSSSITSSKIGHSNAAHTTAATNNNGHQYNVANVAATSTYNYSEIHASAFATPPTRRRFFNHKNLRNALTGVSGVVASHRRTASNGGGCFIDSASILSEGSDHLDNNLYTSAAEKQMNPLRARLGLLLVLLDHEKNGNTNTNTTTSSSSSQNISNRTNIRHWQFGPLDRLFLWLPMMIHTVYVVN